MAEQAAAAASAGRVPATPTRPRAHAPGGQSPAEKKARVGDFAAAPVEDEPFTDEELRVQVRVLKAEVKTLTGAVHELRDKHNVLLAETGGAFTVIDQSFIAEELRWDVCEKELHGISQELARHSAIFVDCETYIKAQLTMAAERMKFHEEDLRKLSETMNDKAAYVQDRFIPDAMDDCQKKLDADMDAFKKGWLPKAVTEMEQVISGKIYDTLHKTFDANIKDLIEGRVAAANAELTNNLKTAPKSLRRTSWCSSRRSSQAARAPMIGARVAATSRAPGETLHRTLFKEKGVLGLRTSLDLIRHETEERVRRCSP